MLSQTLSSKKVALFPEIDLSTPWIRVGRPYLRREEMIFSSLYWSSVEIPGDMTGLTESDDRVLEKLVVEGEIIRTWSSEEAYKEKLERPSITKVSPKIEALEERLGPSGRADPQHLAAWAEELLNRLPADGTLSLLSKSIPKPPSGVSGRRTIAARLLGGLGVPTEATVSEVLDFKRKRQDELDALHLYLGELIEAVSSEDPEQGIRNARERLIDAISDYNEVMEESFAERVDWKGLIGGAVLGGTEMALNAGAQAALAALTVGGVVSLFQTYLSPRFPEADSPHPVAYAYEVSENLQ